ncbi:MAG: GspH/FimT family protein [Phycisphaerae bacterium]|nr:GspH/FimT family protein [Phycisphaerae bacterium]
MNVRIARHGFTMIELLIVVAILAIAAAIVVPMASSAGSMQLRAAVNMVAADLEYAKSMSISRGQRYAVVFDKTAAGIYYQYRVVDQGGNNVPHPITKRPEYVVTFQGDGRLAQVEIASVDFAPFDGTDKVGFDLLGSPFNGNGDSLNSGVITLRAGDITRTVNVEPVTGYITVSN